MVSVIDALRQDGFKEYTTLLDGADTTAPCFLREFTIVGVDNPTEFDFNLGIDALMNSVHLGVELNNNPTFEPRPSNVPVDHRRCTHFDVPSMKGDDPISMETISVGPSLNVKNGCREVSLIHHCDDLRKWLINACAAVTPDTIYPVQEADLDGNCAVPIRSLLAMVAELSFANVYKKEREKALIVDEPGYGVAMCLRGALARESAQAGMRLVDIVRRNCMHVLNDIKFFVSSAHISEDIKDSVDPSTHFGFVVWAKISVVYPSDFPPTQDVAMVADNNFAFTHRLFELCKSESDGCFDPPGIPTSSSSRPEMEDTSPFANPTQNTEEMPPFAKIYTREDFPPSPATEEGVKFCEDLDDDEEENNRAEFYDRKTAELDKILRRIADESVDAVVDQLDALDIQPSQSPEEEEDVASITTSSWTNVSSGDFFDSSGVPPSSSPKDEGDLI